MELVRTGDLSEHQYALREGRHTTDAILEIYPIANEVEDSRP